MSINFHFGEFLPTPYVLFLAKIMPKCSINFSVANYMHFNFRSKMSGERNEKAMCPNSVVQEKENASQEDAVQEEAEATL
jgi:hypothetical protein